MNFEELKRLPLGDAVNAVVAEGGATVAGVFGANMIGRRVQAAMSKQDSTLTSTSGLTDKLMVWGANNGPKIAAWYLLKGKSLLGSAQTDVEKGIVTSVALDTLVRLSNGGKNPGSVTIYGYEVLGGDGTAQTAGSGVSSAEVQKLIQENSVLRAELSRTRAASNVQVQQTPVNAVAGIDERDRKYAFMPGMGVPGVTRTPGVDRRQVKYGFAGEVSAMSATGKPGAAYVQAGKMFNMQ